MVECLSRIHAVLVKKAVHLLYRVNLFRRKSAAIEAHGIDAAECYWIASDDSEWRNIFVDFRTALNHHMAADMAELVHERATANDGEIINFHFSG